MRMILVAAVLLAGALQVPDVDMSLDIEVGTKRAPTPAMNAFRRQTGYPNGRPGWVIDHVVPYCSGGDVVDVLENLAWQERSASYRKDVFERALCVAMKRQGLVVVKQGVTP